MAFEQIYSWELDTAIIFLRYFLIAGLAYLIFYIWYRNYYFGKKIQPFFPQNSDIAREILYSIGTLLIYGLVSKLVFIAYSRGLTRIYFDIGKYGVGYILVSFVLMVLLHDAYFYWTHRLIHHKWIFNSVHLVHHRSNNPTPWASFSFHPLEAALSAGIVPLIIFTIPSHPIAILLFLTNMTLINVLGHLGYELFSVRLRTSKLGQWLNTSTMHNAHHRDSTCNFGLYFTFWDRFMNTYQSYCSNPPDQKG